MTTWESYPMFPWEFHPESVRIIEYLVDNASPIPREQMDIKDIRAGHYARLAHMSDVETKFDVVRTERFIPSPDCKDGIPVYVYTPKNLEPNPKILVYFHGGGFAVGTRMNFEASCNIWAQNAGCIVVNVEYRLAPEFKFPAALDDACVVVEWVKENKVNLGGTELSKVGVGGDSAGGTITASVSHSVPIDFQILVYPQVFPARDYSAPSMQKYRTGPLLDLDYIKWFEDQFVPAGEEKNLRLASILREKFDHLPPALVIIAELDPLYDSSWAYANKLKEAGVAVEVHEYKGAIHAFFGFTKMCPELTKDAYEKVVSFIKRQ